MEFASLPAGAPQHVPTTPDLEMKIKCIKCPNILPLSEFPLGVRGKGKGQPTKTCQSCAKKKSAWTRENRREPKPGQDLDKENVTPGNGGSAGEGKGGSFENLSVISLTRFVTILSMQKDCLDLEADVDVTELKKGCQAGKECAGKIAKLMWDMMSYRWMCVYFSIFKIGS
jgi:hypothetical protein